MVLATENHFARSSSSTFEASEYSDSSVEIVTDVPTLPIVKLPPTRLETELNEDSEVCMIKMSKPQKYRPKSISEFGTSSGPAKNDIEEGQNEHGVVNMSDTTYDQDEVVTNVMQATSNDASAATAKALTRDYHQLFLTPWQRHNKQRSIREESRTVPLFSGQVLDNLSDGTFVQYGLLAAETPKAKLVDLLDTNEGSTHCQDSRVFLNVSPPWSAFICGSQGSGKSHTLSCMLENCLMTSKLGELRHPLSGIVFHYDKFTSYGSNQLCEAAYLCSSGIPVKVLVSPTNFWAMKEKYQNLPGLKGSQRPEVVPLRFRDRQLDVSRIMSLMAVTDKEGPTPLYIEVIMRILRDMAIKGCGRQGFDYNLFRAKLDAEGFSAGQNMPLKLRLELLESFMDRSQGNVNATRQHDSAWSFVPGSLTIVDLSCPFVDESAACALFSICLELFLETRGNVGRVVALDEAHKFMNSSLAAQNFTNTLLDVIRQQRHLATRVIIATQEPTISPKLLDLASMTIVHRFTSPEWLITLRAHLAGACGSDFNVDDDASGNGSGNNVKRNVARLFSEIVELNAGEALLFSPSSMLEWSAGPSNSSLASPSSQADSHGSIRTPASLIGLGLEELQLTDSPKIDGMGEVNDKRQDANQDKAEVQKKDTEQAKEAKGKTNQEDIGKPVKMGMRYVKIKVRERLTADGGRSVMAV